MEHEWEGRWPNVHGSARNFFRLMIYWKSLCLLDGKVRQGGFEVHPNLATTCLSENYEIPKFGWLRNLGISNFPTNPHLPASISGFLSFFALWNCLSLVSGILCSKGHLGNHAFLEACGGYCDQIEGHCSPKTWCDCSWFTLTVLNQHASDPQKPTIMQDWTRKKPLHVVTAFLAKMNWEPGAWWYMKWQYCLFHLPEVSRHCIDIFYHMRFYYAAYHVPSMYWYFLSYVVLLCCISCHHVFMWIFTQGCPTKCEWFRCEKGPHGSKAGKSRQ